MRKIISLFTAMALFSCCCGVNAETTDGVLIGGEGETARIEENFNRDWLFAYGELPGSEAMEIDETGWCSVALPHSFSIPYDLNDDRFYIGTGWYRKEFDVPADWSERFITLDFEGVFQRADIYINGIKVPKNKVYGYESATDPSLPTHEGGYSPFSVNITDYVVFGGKNIVAVKVDNIWQADLTPRGGDHQFSGGIYRDVTLTAVSKAHIDWYGTFVWTPAICNPAFQNSENRPDDQYKDDFERNGTGIINTLDDPNVDGAYVSEDVMLENIKNKTSDVEVRTEISNTGSGVVTLYTENQVIDPDENVVGTFRSEPVIFSAGERKTVIARSGMLKDIRLWDFENPNLYKVKTVVYTADDRAIDQSETVFGFRSAQFKLDGFYLNGVRTLLDGANVHQDHGGWADAVTNMGFYRDVKYVKEAGFNFIRGSHYPHDPAFAKACDELGIGFWSEGGLWSIGGSNDDDTVSLSPSDWARTAYPKDEISRPKFEESCFDLVRSMIRVNRNSPSVIVWSMGNEAFFSDDSVTDDVKSLVNRLRNYAHSLDFTRKAGLGGTQRKDLNTLAVCDVAGGNGDGATERYTNFYLPHIVAEYSSGKNDRPGAEDFQYGEIKNPNDPAKYILPERKILLNDGSEILSRSAGLSIWCMYHHGSIGSRNLRIMGLMDYYRLPTTRYYMYRKDRTGIEMPAHSKSAAAVGVVLRASTDTMHEGDGKTDKHIITNDGKSDIHIIATMVDENGNWVNDSKDVTIKVIDGNGVFPTGKEYKFISGLTMLDGKGAIEFRSYYSGETKIQAFIDGEKAASNVLTVTCVNALGAEGGSEPADFMTPEKPFGKKVLEEPETFGKIDVAQNRQSRADSSFDEMLPVNAIDGNSETYWESDIMGGNQSWWVHMENTYYVYKVKLDTPSKNFDLSYQTPSGEWTSLGNYTNADGEIDLGGIFTSCIKVTFRDTPDGERARLYSFNAYGTAFHHFDPTGKFLSDMESVGEITQGWEGKKPGINVSIEGNPLSAGGRVYEKGLGLHADSEAVYRLDKKYSRFTAIAAIDDEVGSYSSESGVDGAVFKVYGKINAGEETETELLLFEEKITDKARQAYVDISVVDVDELRLVTEKVSSNSKDHTDWLEPVLWGAPRDISLGETRTEMCTSDGYVHIRLKEKYSNAFVRLAGDGNIYRFNGSVISIKTEKASPDLEVFDSDGGIIGIVGSSDMYFPEAAPAFMDCFEPMPIVEGLSAEAWGAGLVGARDQGNGIEDKALKDFTYWDGGIIKDDETGKYYMFGSKWNQANGFIGWKNSMAFYATSDNLYGPYVEQGSPLWPDNRNGAGHNVFPFKLKENDPYGKYAIINSDNGRPGDIFVADSLDGPWKYCTSITSNMKGSGFAAINVAVFLRPDGRYEALGRHGDIAVADDLKGPWTVMVDALWEHVPGLPYKDSDGGNRLEDPTIWYSNGMYHCVVNHWNLKKAFYMTSEDGITNWKLHSGSAYEPGADFLRYADGTVNHWNKIERPYAYIENGELKAFTFAVVDFSKEEDMGNDSHGSKIIVVPFNSEKLNRVIAEPFRYFERTGIPPEADSTAQTWREENVRSYGANATMRMQVNNTDASFGLFGEKIEGGASDDCKISYLKYDVSGYDLSKLDRATLSLIFKNRRVGSEVNDKIRVVLADNNWIEGPGSDIQSVNAQGNELSWTNRPSLIYDSNNLEATICESTDIDTDKEYQVLEIDVTKLVKSADTGSGKVSFALCNTAQGNTLSFLTKDFGDKYSALLNLDCGAEEVKVYVNGQKIDFDVPPMITDGTTMLPIRSALEPLGAEFTWDEKTRTVTISAGGRNVVLTADSNAAYVDGAPKFMSKPAAVINGRTFIPIRFVAETLGYDVQWNGETRTVIIQG